MDRVSAFFRNPNVLMAILAILLVSLILVTVFCSCGMKSSVKKEPFVDWRKSARSRRDALYGDDIRFVM